MKKKLFAILLAVVMMASVVVVLASCSAPEFDPEIIAKAEKMDLADLEKAAEEEFKAAGVKFTAKATTSGVGKVLKKFKEKYTWFDYDEFSSSKDQAIAEDITATLAKNKFFADFSMVQIASNIKTWTDAGYLRNYVPKNDNEIQLDPKATAPLVGLYADKLFTYNKTAAGDVTLQNIWQLTGKDGATLKKVKGSSIQNPSNEGINMAFMIMLTSSKSCEKLTAAYKSYFGTDYTAQEGCKNIGYYFIQQYLKALTENHSSDSKVLSETLQNDTTGTVFVVGLNKTKGYSHVDKEKNEAGEEKVVKNYWYDDLFYSGVHGDVEGYNGFTYNTYLSIPKSSRLPYTACLFARYILTEEGFRAGWKDVGYSSPNAKVTPNVDKTVSLEGGYKYELNTDKVLQEDAAYTLANYNDVYKFVTSNWTAK